MAASALRGISKCGQLVAISALTLTGFALMLIWGGDEQQPRSELVRPEALPQQSAGPAAAEAEPSPPEQPAEPSRPTVVMPPGSPMDAHRDLIRLCLYQADAVIVDMQLFRYTQEEPDAEAVRRAGRRLAVLQERLDEAEVPEEMEEVTSLLQQLLARLRGSYRDRQPAASEGREDLWESLAREAARFRTSTEGLSEDLSEPVPQLGSQEDLQQYRQAVAAIEAGDLAEAYAALKALEERHPDNAFVLLRKADCVAHVALGDGEPVGETHDPEAEALAVLDRLIETDSYHPLLLEIWLKWRTLTQSHRHGVSNYSDIPNWDYNEKRGEFVRLIRGHLAERPGDGRALVQKEALLQVPNIRRGGLTGNTNLAWWGMLFAGDVMEDAIKSVKKAEESPEQ